MQKAMYTRAHLTRHNYAKHRHLPDTIEEVNQETNIIDDSMDQVFIPSPAFVPPVVLQSQALQTFLEKSIEDGMIVAIRNFVCGACFGTSVLSRDEIATVPLHDTYMVLLTSRLVFRIGTVHQLLLSTLLSVFVSARPQLGHSSLPITRAQMIRIITNITSSTSIASSIPTPRPFELKHRHACLDLKDVIGHALGMHPATNAVADKYKRLLESPQGQQSVQEAKDVFDTKHQPNLPKLVCGLTFWFDGWDPNSSLSKANKSPIWSGTVTIIMATLDKQILFVTTRVIASGPGKGDHTEVIQHILENVQSMQNACAEYKFWVRTYMGYALVYPRVLHVVCDQPERRTISGLMAGNSKLHACFGVSCDTSLLKTPLNACYDCETKIELYLKHGNYQHMFLHPCTMCLQWSLPSIPGCHAKYEYKQVVDCKFPIDAQAGASLNTHAGVVTMSTLKKAWEEAFENWVLTNVWTQKQVEVYFKVLTINDATITKFVDQGRRCILAKAFWADQSTVTNIVLRNELVQRLQEFPLEYEKPVPPPMWSLVSADQLPEAVMHLAMGVVKSVSKFIHSWAAARNKSPYLAERLNFNINMQRQYCRVGRCPMATYSQLGKFPGWVADTFRSWWIWMPWMYSTLDNSKFLYTTYTLPQKPPHQWNGKQCKQFLKSRGYPGYTKLNAKACKDIVTDMSHLRDWPQTEVTPAACAISGADLQSLVWHCHSLFKNMFAEPHLCDHQHAANAHVKMLLSVITRLDLAMHPDENLPNLYEVKYNFISLPRAVHLLGTYGSARNIQEGGIDGEGVVKMLRPLTPRGLKQHFSRNLMDAFHRDQQLQELCDEVSTQLFTTNIEMDQTGITMQSLVDSVEADLNDSEDVGSQEISNHPDIMFQRLTLTNDEEDNPVQHLKLEFALDSQQFKRYKTVQQIMEYQEVGLPLSFVVALVNSESCIGLVVGSGTNGVLVPLLIRKVVVDSIIGFPYFHIEILYDPDVCIQLYSNTNIDAEPVQHHSLLNYGHLLPHLATLEQGECNFGVPYAIVTTDGNHMDASYTFI